jgi:pilus assembly protein Flp/PilA
VWEFQGARNQGLKKDPKMLELIRRIRKCDQGATAVEYGLIVSLIVIAIAASIGNLGNGTQVMWNSVSEKVLESSS